MSAARASVRFSNLFLFILVFLILSDEVDCHGWFLNMEIRELYDIALAMSSSRADPVLGHCPSWGYLDIFKYPHTGQCH